MSKRKVYHVVWDDNGNKWQVKKEGSERASSNHPKKPEAINKARELAKNAPLGQIKIHKKNGTIQTEHTYGEDPEKYLG